MRALALALLVVAGCGVKGPPQPPTPPSVPAALAPLDAGADLDGGAR
ncbi:MAG: hypothetical protein JST54_05470 [Deltaproteobacteria bacterium]|nr:hypothetical protein [Deltaproteobacteria bacterium]